MARTIPRVGRMRDVHIASKQWVSRVSCSRRPRHMDRAFVAIAYLYRKHSLGLFRREKVMNKVARLHAQCMETRALGPRIESFVETTLDYMINAGYITTNDSNDMIQITPAAAKMMREIDNCVKAAKFSSPVDGFYACCDYYRQKVGTVGRKTIEGLEARIERLEQRHIAHKRVCPMTREDSASSDNSSPAHDDVDMHEEQPIVGSSSIPLTPARHTHSMTPDSAYLTPVSLPPSPTQYHSPPRLPGMEVDDPITGPLIASINATPARKPILTDMAVAYPTPASPPSRWEGTRNTLSLPPSPSPRGSFLHVHDDNATNGMDVDDNSDSLPSSDPLQTNTPTPEGFFKRCFGAISKVVPFSALRLPPEPSLYMVTHRLEQRYTIRDAARLATLRSNGELTQMHEKALADVTLLEQQLQMLRAECSSLEIKLSNSEKEHNEKTAELVERYESKSEELKQANKELEGYKTHLQLIIQATGTLNQAVHRNSEQST